MASQSLLKISLDPKDLALPGGGATPYNENAPTDTPFHPDFSSEDSDIILRSSDGISFRVYSIVLRLSSGWFKTLFKLPQTQSTKSSSPPTSEPIMMQETSEVLAVILSMASGMPFPRINDMEFVASLVHAAEKYDMLGVLSILRLVILSPTFLDSHPIRVYAIACRWGWQEEAKVASSHTISLDLLSEEVRPDLRKVDPLDLTRLLLLHRKRRDLFKKGLDSEDLFYANVIPGSCSGCMADIIHDKWHRMKYDWVTAVEHRPIDTASRDLLERLELEDVLNSKCTRCQKKLYNAEGTISNLRQILDELPKYVEFD